MSKSSKKTKTTTGKVKVFVDVKRGVTAVIDTENRAYSTVVPFRGADNLGTKFFIFNRNESNMLRWEIIEDFFPEHINMTEQQQEELYNKIEKYVDVSVYYALRKYDNDNGYKTSKSEEYVKSALKTLNKRTKSMTDEQFIVKETELKRKAFENTGISITYRKGGIIGNRTTLIDRMKIMRNIKNTQGFVSVEKSDENRANVEKRKITGIKDLKDRVFQGINNIAHDAKELFSKPGLITWMRERTEAEKYKFRKKLIRVGAIALAGLAIFGVGRQIKLDDVNGENLYTEGTDNKGDKDESSILDELIGENSSIDDIIIQSQESSQGTKENDQEAKGHSQASKENDQEVEENSQAQNEKIKTEDNLQQNQESAKVQSHDLHQVNMDDISSDVQENVDISLSEEQNRTMSLNDALMATLDIGFDTEFKIPEGKYYQTPHGTGNYGYYDNKLGNFKASIAGTAKEGGYCPYYPDCEKSFYEIKCETDGIVSYSIVNANGQDIYGWNPSDQNNIEEWMVKSEIDRILPYLSQEAKEFLQKSDLSESINIKEKINILSQIKLAQNKANAERENTRDSYER